MVSLGLKKEISKWLAVLTLACVVSGCTTFQPPVKIRSAITVINRNTAAYVIEANKAFAESGRPDAGRLIGIGMRLQLAADALDRWANGEKDSAQ